MGPNCLQRLAADTSRERLSSLHDEDFYVLFCHQLLFFHFFMRRLISASAGHLCNNHQNLVL